MNSSCTRGCIAHNSAVAVDVNPGIGFDPSTGPIRVVIVANMPTPYRVPVFARLSQESLFSLTVLFCTGREPNRQWDFAELNFPHSVMEGRTFSFGDKYIHFNRKALKQLSLLRPDVVVTTGFNPTHLLAFLYCVVKGASHVPMTDGTVQSERRLTFVHRLVRKLVYSRSRAFVGAGKGSALLYESYSIDSYSIFQSHLCSDNRLFVDLPGGERQVDLVFSGRFVPDKMPLFALDVAVQVARRLGRRVKLTMVGSGELDVELSQAAAAVRDFVEVTFTGFVAQRELPAHYSAAKLLLFPTVADAWGVVANESLAAGTPVIISPHAGAANDLVQDGVNGRVLELDLQLWSAAAVELLSDGVKWRSMSSAARESIGPFSYENAAGGLRDAIVHAARRI